MIFEKMNQAQAANDQVAMALELLMAVIERTGNFREGFYALRMVSELQKSLYNGAVMSGIDDPEQAIDALIQHLNNTLATINTQIERIDE